MTSPRKYWSLALLTILPLGALLFLPPSVQAQAPQVVQPPTIDEPMPAAATTETAVLAGG